MIDPISILNLLPQPVLVIDTNFGIISYMNKAFVSKFSIDVNQSTKFYDLISADIRPKLIEIIESLNETNPFQEMKNLIILFPNGG